MKETLDAIYENGLLRPLKKLSFPEGRRVRVTLESEQEDETPARSSKEQENNRTAGPEENDDSMPPYMKVREALSGCAGEISEDISRAREDRIRYTTEERSASVDEISRMALPVGTWEEMEEEIQKGATEQ